MLRVCQQLALLLQQYHTLSAFLKIISYFGFGFISVYNSILFCCLRRNVEPCRHTHDSRSTVIVYSARPCLVGLALWVITCGTWWSNTRIKQKASRRCDIQPRCSQIFVENCDFSLPRMHSTPLLRGFPSKYCHAVWYGKTRMVWLPDGEKILNICLFILTECTNVTDRHRLTAKAVLDAGITWQKLTTTTELKQRNAINYKSINYKEVAKI